MTTSKNMWFQTLIAVSCMTAASSFTGGRAPFLAPREPTTFRQRAEATSSSLSVLIYGWDGDDEVSSTDVYDDNDIFGGSTASSSCSPMGAAVAETISQNQDKVGTLARLAVAFSPPDRALDIDNIDKIDIVCVTESHIELEAVLCEHQGCISLFVPVQFPRDCGSEDIAWMEKCVLENLDALDVHVESTQSREDVEADFTSDADDDLQELCKLYSDSEYPSWWVPPECNDSLVAECNTISSLLNGEDFQGDVNALARRGLESLDMGGRYEVKRAVVSAVGPAGLCIRARAAPQYESHEPIRVLDVPLPFGGDPKLDPASLRAAVLGAVAAAQAD